MNAKIYLDMDGVLADFVGGSLKAHGKSIPPKDVQWDFMKQVGFNGGGDPAFWGPISNPDFWANLDVLPDGAELFRYLAEAVKVENIGILSSGLCPGSCDGKRAWLKKHFPELERTALFGTVKHMAAAPCKILVDDHEPNVEAFRNAKGKAFLVPRPWNSKAEHTDAEGNFEPKRLANVIAYQWHEIVKS